jgi:hypothetical protein
MRKVVSRSEVFRLWARQAQDEASETNGGRTYFRDKTCYSYGSHFPIAKLDGKGNCLFTLQGYSNTTAKHISEARYAADNRGLNIIYCYDINDRETSLNYWETNIRNLMGELANKRNRNTQCRIESIRHNVAQLEAYCQYFNIILEFEFATLVAFSKAEDIVQKVRMVAV